MSTLESVHKLQASMGESIIGQESVIEQLIIGLLANGNILMEGLPGLAKTRAVKSLAINMDAGSVHRHGHTIPHRAGRHLPFTGSADGSFSAACLYRLRHQRCRDESDQAGEGRRRPFCVKR